MVRTRRLKRGEVTYSWAKEEETNVLIALKDPRQTEKYLSHLRKHSDLVRRAAAHHLNLPPEKCETDVPKNWMLGSFNICIPILVCGRKEVLMRFPILHRVGESFRPGNADEKIRCEAGTYAWLDENCPSIPVPKLYGFALSTGQSFTAVENLPLLPRLYHYVRCRMLRLFGRTVPSGYVRHQGPALDGLKAGYVLIQYLDKSKGTMLSCTWNDKRHDKDLRANLFKGLTQIILKLAKVPVPRIGSFVINDDGFLVLSNRPLSLEIHQLEREEIPVDIPRGMTYCSVDSYVADTLSFHDSRLHHQPNAINDEFDGIFQATALATMRSVASHFFQRDLRRGPFIYMLNDLHQSNILVDEGWNVRYLIDLEWACSRPIEMLHPPHWLTGENVDMDSTAAELFAPIHQEFTGALEQEEKRFHGDNTTSLSEIMNRGWETKMFWFSLALMTPTGPSQIFYNHIRQKIVGDDVDRVAFLTIMKHMWTQDMKAFIAKKLKDKDAYERKLQEEFDVLPAI
ncbi:hypothetical protein FQN50_008834 [Emmonsiellopsis sp. PD_5]|nr:hypothetical protein FQN50_008834 [Emmonsiellopsis sp. PD_5]